MHLMSVHLQNRTENQDTSRSQAREDKQGLNLKIMWVIFWRFKYFILVEAYYVETFFLYSRMIENIVALHCFVLLISAAAVLAQLIEV